ncbi:class I SAM-dependent methyltransferase [Alkaliphilus transvaalensis]|uniref:class I SAM-dependent methyltransferase n=1 Tax=Alkaliphilus transvaalensis TaxID=114628 RepID=UPI000687D375|nr:class I SAM-dependent methyltransferase [Alkaliphilus transvaalensis]
MSRQKLWDFWALHYEKLWVQKVSLTPTRREVIKLLEGILKKGNQYKILDVGCGIGQLLREIKDHFEGFDLELVGVDFSKEMIERAKVSRDTIVYHHLDVNEIDTLDSSFDIIICTHSFPYYENQEGAITDFKQLLKGDGSLILAQASQNNFYDQIAMFFVKFTTGKAKYPSVKEISQMVSSQFSIEDTIRIKERFFMPSIYLFLLKGDHHEDSTYQTKTP